MMEWPAEKAATIDDLRKAFRVDTMVKYMCSIYDVKAEVWTTPMFFQAKGQAIRSFADAINSEGEFGKHPEDYTLFYLGEFDERSGLVSPAEAPEPLAVGINLVENGD